MSAIFPFRVRPLTIRVPSEKHHNDLLLFDFCLRSKQGKSVSVSKWCRKKKAYPIPPIWSRTPTSYFCGDRLVAGVDVLWDAWSCDV